MAKCARTACDNQAVGCIHSLTGMDYCAYCARKINEYTPGLVSWPEQEEIPDTEWRRAEFIIDGRSVYGEIRRNHGSSLWADLKYDYDKSQTVQYCALGWKRCFEDLAANRPIFI